MRAIIILFVCCFSMIGFSQNDSVFSEANTLYNNGKYAEAIDKYESILDSDQHSAELYFNLGNANYKLNNIAPSIYYYEKALLLEPNDKDIQNNLAFAQNMTIDANCHWRRAFVCCYIFSISFFLYFFKKENSFCNQYH